MLHDEKERMLTGEEVRWIKAARSDVMSAGNVIAQMAQVMEFTFHLYHTRDLDPVYREKVCNLGIETMAQAIRLLANVVTNGQEEINGILSGMKSAEINGRREFLRETSPSLEKPAGAGSLQ